jgi:hypothetical protein
MNKQLRTLGLAGLIGLAGFLASGCGSDDETTFSQAPTTQVNELIIIPNATSPGTLTLKFINLLNGTSVLGSQGFNTGGNAPEVVKVHPTRPQFFVGNTGSGNVASFSVNGAAGVTTLGNIAAPAGVKFLMVHPNGAFVYAAGGASIQTYAVQPDGSLQAVGAAQALAGTVGEDGCFSNNGATLHVPVQGFIQSFPVNTGTGVLGAAVNTALGAAGDQGRDVNVHPNGTSLVANIQIAGGANDQVRSYALAGGTIGAVTVQNFTFDIGQGDMARNGQYFLGQTGAPANIRGYNVNAATGAITEFATSPVANPNSSFQIGIDPSQQFIFATGGGTLDTQGRLSDGRMSGVTSDGAGVSAASRRFDFFQYVQTI